MVSTEAILAGLAAALFFGLNSPFLRIATKKVNPTQVTFLTVLIGLLMTISAAVAVGDFHEVTQIGLNPLLLLGLAGILHYTLSRTLTTNAVKLIGATRTQNFQESSTVYAVAFAIFLLGEQLTPRQTVGVGISLSGIFLMSMTGKTLMEKLDVHRKTFLIGMSLGLTAGLLRGITPLLIRVSLVTGVSPFVGNMISYMFAAISFLPVLYAPGLHHGLWRMSKVSALYVLGAGVTITLAQTFRYLALSLEGVIIISLLLRLSPIFTLAIGATILRKMEAVNRRVVLAVLVMVSGTMVLLS